MYRCLGWTVVFLATLSITRANALAREPELRITHGPMLGRPGPHSMGVWARTSRPGVFRVRYGADPQELGELSPPCETGPEDDNTGWVGLEGLSARTRYAYEVFVPDGPEPDAEHRGTFRTLPDPEQYRHPELNPRGLFNFAFEFACGNHQGHRQDVFELRLPTYETMLEELDGEIDFAILNGDWLYEARRDWPVEQWRKEVGIGSGEIPRPVAIAPTIVGVWANYRLYLDRPPALRAWHRRMPSLYTFDDHELIDDIQGSGQPGVRQRAALFRDIGTRAWYDYLGWANPAALTQPTHFGRATLEAGSNVLTDPRADFRRLKRDEMSNLHVHWGGPHAGMQSKEYDDQGGDPNAGVYEIVDALDAHRLRIRPAARATGTASYSVGRYSFGKLRVANCDIFLLDTRSHRWLADNDNPQNPGATLLGPRQKEWLKREMRQSDAQFFFLVSSVNFMVRHIIDIAGPGRWSPTSHDEAWTAFLEEREEMIRFCDSLGKPVFVLTGDIHNSFVVKVTDRVWEFAAGPHQSGNARAASEGDRPPSGPFDSLGRPCEIRWSTYVANDARARQKVYCVVQVNNVFNNPPARDPRKPRWIAFPRPQVVFRYHSGRTGELLYAESIVAAE